MPSSMPFSVTGNVVDIFNKKIYPGKIVLETGKVISVMPLDQNTEVSGYILPGFIDSHVHIESSMLIPSEFARLAVIHGTVATISDPHEIANVCGMDGVNFMIDDGKAVPFKFNFGAPSCVPATDFETAGAKLDGEDVKKLLERPEIKYLSEMMNFPGVLNHNEEVLKKLKAAQLLDKPVDGHAPGLRGEQAKKYIEAGISTDHECFTAEEALDKLKHGMWILIREGSAAKNFDALAPLLHEHFSRMMFCSDDKHPDSLLEGHINQLCARAVAKGIDLFKVLQAACINPVKHYKLEVGLLREGDMADFIVAEDLVNFKVLKTYIGGELVADNGKPIIKSNAKAATSAINNFNCNPVDAAQLKLLAKAYPLREGKIPVIEALDGQLITNARWLEPTREGDEYVSDVQKDLLKLVVINRYSQAPPAKCFIKNFGFKRGAIASSVAHDSHNIVAVGTSDEELLRAINLVIEQQGGVSAVTDAQEKVLPLPVAGLMSAADGFSVASEYTAIDKMAKSLGGNLSAPFMTLSFMALLVIPHLKLSDKGLFNGDQFKFVL